MTGKRIADAMAQCPHEIEIPRRENLRPNTLLQLAKRCEAAAGPDRDIDEQIGLAVGEWDYGAWHDAAEYTASLDAAMALVPEGAEVEMGTCGENEMPWAGVTFSFINDCSQHLGGGHCVALSLCAAALRARAASVDTRRMAETGNTDSVRSTGGAVGEAETPKGHRP